MMIGFCKVIDYFFLDIQGQANIEKQLISYKNMEEMFSDLGCVFSCPRNRSTNMVEILWI
jgi:hypothetical protein